MNNKGFTLVEFIVTAAIVAVVGSAIAGFISVASNLYRATASEITVQEDAQSIGNQIKDMAIDATNGVGFSVTGASGETFVETDEGLTGLTKKTIYIYNMVEAYAIVYDTADEKLYYNKYTITQKADGTFEMTPTATMNILMADHVTLFSADLSDFDATNSMVIRLGLELNGRTYETKTNITLRNQVALNAADLGTLYEETYKEMELTIPKAINISPVSVVSWPGTTTSFGYECISAIYGGFPSKKVSWSIIQSVAEAGSSTISAGVLQIANDTTGNFKVRVTSELDTQIYAEAAVSVNKVTGLSVSVLNKASSSIGYPASPNEDVTVQTNVSTRYATTTASDQNIIWSVVSGSGVTVSTDASDPTKHILHFSSTANGTVVLKLVPERNQGTEFEKTLTFEVKENPIIAFSKTTSTLCRGESKDIEVKLSGVSHPENYYVHWTHLMLQDSDKADYSSSLTATSGVAADSSTSNLNLVLGTDLAKDESYQISGTATLMDGSTEKAVTGLEPLRYTITVPVVSIEFSLFSDYSNSTKNMTLYLLDTVGATTKVYCKISGIVSQASELEWTETYSGNKFADITKSGNCITISRNSVSKKLANFITYSANGINGSSFVVYRKAANITLGGTGYYVPEPGTTDFPGAGFFYYNESIRYKFYQEVGSTTWKAEIQELNPTTKFWVTNYTLKYDKHGWGL